MAAQATNRLYTPRPDLSIIYGNFVGKDLPEDLPGKGKMNQPAE